MRSSACFAAIAAIVSLTIVSHANGQSVPLLGNHPLDIASLKALGPADPTKQLNMEVSFALRDTDALNRLNADQQDPSSSQYRHWLTPQEFAARFGPSDSDF